MKLLNFTGGLNELRAVSTSEQKTVSDQAGYLSHSDELAYLNRHHGYSCALTERKNIQNPLRRVSQSIKHAIRTCLRNFLFGDYFLNEAHFHAHLVRCLNDLTAAIDAKYWRMEDSYRSSLHSLEKRMQDKLHSSLAHIADELGALKASAEFHQADLRTLDAVARGLERIVARIPTGNEAIAVNYPPNPTNQSYPRAYMLLENRFRGREEEIAKRLSLYPDFFRNCKQPVLEVGSGRGELQDLFRSQDIPSYGLELSREMCAHCLGRQFDVRQEDGLTHLAALADRSLGGLIAVQVVEHLSRTELNSFLSLAAKKVRSGGKVVLETINTASVVALTQNYYRDPTHVLPIHADTLRLLVETAGLHVCEVRSLSPFPPAATLQEIPLETYMTPRWKDTVELLNLNFGRLNNLLFGFQDFCIVAEVPESLASPLIDGQS